ncbi:chemotaxis protein CheD [Maridesulfovibrio ferrireducens]|uniref:chemotaxis protein CheD n=1 Tax=Maridesulfovibrio ferrireducens TaxID=246191 RepID=UPI001A33AEB3|nr:chemotaxis protein CheD [Maridesulfovibrio ferrireducens]MBI9111749.1 chemotaxis protein CheD [Maridesulfovibrio ferrireducens]
MVLKNSDIPHVFLHTGDAFIGVSPTIVSTVLGSCVAITMFSPRMKQGAICHAFLPSRKEINPDKQISIQICRYVDTAVDHLLACMLRIGTRKNELEVKIFGGASGLTLSKVRAPPSFAVGGRNIQMALDSLSAIGLHPKAMDTGGNVGRKILFATHSGNIWLKRLDKQTLLKTTCHLTIKK